MKLKKVKYWYIDENGNPHAFLINEGDPVESHWTKGNIPISEQESKKRSARLSALHRGVPKSHETRYKMSIAKQGKSKSPEHVDALKKAHALRQERVKVVMEKTLYRIHFFDACTKEKELRLKYDLGENVPLWYKNIIEKQRGE